MIDLSVDFVDTFTDSSQHGETLECVMYRNNCTTAIEIVIQLNPHIHVLPCVLPTNTQINLPYNQTQTTAPVVRKSLNLWS